MKPPKHYPADIPLASTRVEIMARVDPKRDPQENPPPPKYGKFHEQTLIDLPEGPRMRNGETGAGGKYAKNGTAADLRNTIECACGWRTVRRSRTLAIADWIQHKKGS